MHEVPCSPLAFSLKNYQAERLVQRLVCATRKYDLSRLCGLRQSLEVLRNNCVLGLCPRRLSLESRRHMKDVNVLLTSLDLLGEKLTRGQERESHQCAEH